MIGRAMRLLFGAAFSYAFLRVGYPEPGHSVYHVLAPLVILGAAMALAFALTLLEFASRSIPVLSEALFTVAVFVVLGLTMPAKGGPALPQLMAGAYPTRASVAEGLPLVWVDPRSATGRRIVALFPR